MDLVQDSATSTGLGDAGKRVMEQYDLEKQIRAQEKSQAGAGKAAQAKIMETYGSVLSKPYEEFKPSQESLGGFAALGSLLMVAGAMMGGKGRLSGIGAMNNIAGMMKGYQEGRKDLYEQERKQFDENMKTFEKNRGLIKEAFDRALKMAPTNLKAANDILRRDLQALGATVPAEMVGKSGAVQAAGSYSTFHGNTNTTLEQLKDKLGKMKAEERAREADVKALGAGTLEYGKFGEQTGMFTHQQILAGQQKGQTFTPIAKPSASGTGALEYGSIDDVEGMYTRDQIIQAGPKFKPLAKPTASGTRQPIIDSEGFYRDPITMELRKDAEGKPVKAGGSRATNWVQSTDKDGKPVYIDKNTREIITGPDNEPLRPPSKKGGLQPSASERKNYNDIQSMMTSVDYLENKLSDPEFAKKIDQYRVASYLTDDTNKFFSQIVSASLPDDVREFTIRANDFRNKYYLALSGKAVTGGEAQRNYGVVPQPGDSAKSLKSKLKIMGGYLDDETKVLERTYPDLEDVGKRTKRTVDVDSEADAELLAPGTKFRLPDGRTGTVQ